MVKGRTRKFLIGGVFCGILLAVSAVMLSTMAFLRGADAIEGDTEFTMSIKPYLTVDFPAFIFIDAEPTYTGIQTADAKMRVSTNEEGYVIVVSADRSRPGADDGSFTNLVNISENATIPTLTSPTNKLDFPVGYWGYSIDGGENYRGLTTYNDDNRLVLASDQLASTTTNFTFAVRINDVQPAGIYNSTILITTVATMDDIPDPTEIRAKALLGSNGHLVFVYDDQYYEPGDPYITSNENMAITDVYYVPQMSTDYIDITWRDNSNINTAVFESSFQYFEPLSTNGWFYGLSGLSEIKGIENLNMSRVTDARSMFAYSHLAPQIADLDVSNVRYMYRMFYYFCQGGCYGSLDLSRWDVSNVVNMQSMFYHINSNISNDYYTLSFLDSIRNWNVSNVTKMNYMFAYAYYSSSDSSTSWSFTFDLRNWDVSKVTDMNHMFYNVASSVSTRRSISVYINMDNLDMSKVQDLSYMFSGTASTDTLSIIANNWQLDSATTMTGIFGSGNHGLGTYTLKLHGWKIPSNIPAFSLGGGSTDGLDVDLSDWQVANPGDLIRNLIVKSSTATTWRMNFSGWNTSTMTDFSNLFSDIGQYSGSGSSFYLNVTGWNTSNVTTMRRLFGDCWYHNIEIVGIENWDTRKVTDMYQAFRRFGGGTYYWYNSSYSRWDYYEYKGSYDASNSRIKYGLDNWTFDKVVDMTGMFEFSALNSRVLNKIKNWNSSRVVSMSRMFALAGLNARVDFGNWDVSSVANMTEMFTGANLSYLNLSGWHTNSLTSVENMFKSAVINESDTSRCNYTYDQYGYLVGFSCDVDESSVAGIILDNFDMTRITSLSGFFRGLSYSRQSEYCAWVYLTDHSNDTLVCYNNTTPLANVSIRGWDTRNVLNMDYMFNIGSGPAIAFDGLTSLNTSNVLSMSHTFQSFRTDPTVWNYDFSDWDMSRVTNMSYMFADIEPTATTVDIDFSGFNSTSVLDMNHMFSNAGAAATTFSIVFGDDFSTSSVRDMKYMFYNAGAKARTFTMDLSSFDTSNVQDMSYMLFNSGKIAANFSVDITGWDVSNVYSHEYFCDRLEMVQPIWH